MTPEPPLGMDPNQRIAWDDGVESYLRGLPITADHPYCCGLKDVWEMGWKAAGEVAPRLESPKHTTQALIDAWEKARNELRAHVWKLLPYDCAVVVDNHRYKGPGVVKGYPSDDMSQIQVTIPNGNTWHYPVTSVRRVQ